MPKSKETEIHVKENGFCDDKLENSKLENEFNVNGITLNKTSFNETSANKTSVNENTSNETTLNESAANETTLNETAVNEINLNETALNETSINDINETPVNISSLNDDFENDVSIDHILDSKNSINENEDPTNEIDVGVSDANTGKYETEAYSETDLNSENTAMFHKEEKTLEKSISVCDDNETILESFNNLDESNSTIATSKGDERSIKKGKNSNGKNKNSNSKNRSKNDKNKSKLPVVVAKRSNQIEYIQRIVLRALWKHPKSWPFKEPVDPVRDSAMDYYDIVKNPMDLGTIRTKLLHNQYETTDECIADFKLIFDNCYLYNPEELPICDMCKCLETFFYEKLKNMPSGEETSKENIDPANIKVSSKKRSKDASSYRVSSKKLKIEKMDSLSSTVENDMPTEDNSVEKDLNVDNDETNIVDIKKNNSTAKSKSTLNETKPLEDKGVLKNSEAAAQSIKEPEINDIIKTNTLKFCLEMVKDLYSKKYETIAWPFYEPVDSKALNLPDYDKIINYPTDLKTIKNKIEKNLYSCAFECISDIKRMLINCFRYNPDDHVVFQAGQKLGNIIDLYIARAPPDIYNYLVVAPSFISKSPHNCSTLALKGTTNNSLPLKKTPQKDSKTQPSLDKPKARNEEDSSDCDEEYVNPLACRTTPSQAQAEVEHAEPMTYQEKRKLAMEINKLPSDKLGDAIVLLADLEENTFEKSETEVVIDFDVLKAETLRHLEKFIKYLNKPSKTKKKKPKNQVSGVSSIVGTVTNLSDPNKTILSKNVALEKNKALNSNSAGGKYFPLSEESDHSDTENSKAPNRDEATNYKNKPIKFDVSQSINNGLSLTQSSKPVANRISDHKQEGKDKLVQFQTIEDSFLPSCMLDVQNKAEATSTEMVSKAKAALENQKFLTNSVNMMMPESPINQHLIIDHSPEYDEPRSAKFSDDNNDE